MTTHQDKARSFASEAITAAMGLQNALFALADEHDDVLAGEQGRQVGIFIDTLSATYFPDQVQTASNWGPPPEGLWETAASGSPKEVA